MENETDIFDTRSKSIGKSGKSDDERTDELDTKKSNSIRRNILSEHIKIIPKDSFLSQNSTNNESEDKSKRKLSGPRRNDRIKKKLYISYNEKDIEVDYLMSVQSK